MVQKKNSSTISRFVTRKFFGDGASGKRSIQFYVVPLLVALSLITAKVSGQIVGATVSGTVSDASGAVVPNAPVAFANSATGVTTNATTDAAGFYTVPNLQPGPYDVTASAPGFAQVHRKVTLTVGQELVLNISMQVGTVSQTVQVSAEAPTVDLTNSTLGGISDLTTVSEIPLNGRSWTDLAALQPGVHFAQNQPPINATDRGDRGFGLQLSISGGRPQQNTYLIDGINMNDYSNTGPGSLLGGNLGSEAVAEFSVLTTNYSTEYGRTSGGVISAITKSGTNNIHGSAYEFVRNSAFDAPNFFDNSSNSPKPPFRRNQFGASIGGPIQKDKTFIFGDYEGIRQNLGSTTISTVPSPAARLGDLTGGAVTVDPVMARFLTFFPLPNGAVTGDTGLFSFPAAQITTENFFTIRGDHVFSDKDRVSATVVWDKTPQTSPDEFNNKVIASNTFRGVVAIEENHVFSPQLLNSFRVGVNRNTAGLPAGGTAINPAVNDPSFSSIPGMGVGEIDIHGLTNFSGGFVEIDPHFYFQTAWQANDNIFLTKGIHSMKFGGNVERIERNVNSTSAPAGRWIFNSLANFLTDQPASVVADAAGSIVWRYYRQSLFGLYFQDDIHLRPNLTVNVGLRYEPASAQIEKYGHISVLHVLNSAPPNPTLGNPLFANPSKKNFEPRVGFSWDPFKNGKTAIRGGAGIFDILPLLVEGSSNSSGFPFTQRLSSSGVLPVGSFPTEAISLLGGKIFTQYFMEPNPKRNYVGQWNLNIQRQIAPGTTVMIGYVGSRGIHMFRQVDDANMVYPTQTPQGLLWPLPEGSGTILNPLMGRTQSGFFDGDYWYDGLQTQITKTMSHGFQVGGSYTWAKNIDDGSSGAKSDQYRNSISTLLFFCGACTRGLSEIDIRHDLSVNYVWDLPTPASFGRGLRAVVGGWETSGVLTVESGSPFTVTIPGDPLGMNSTDTWQFPNRLTGPGCGSDVNPGNPNQYVKVQCFAAPNPVTLFGNEGRNSLTGPGLIDLDFALIKNIPIKESFKAQFRAEFFNILNRANFTSPTDNLGILNPDGTPVPFGGQMDQTNTTSRQVQFALKLIW